MRTRSYVVMFCVLIFAISMALSSCVDKKVNNKEGDSKAVSESATENSPMKKANADSNTSKGTAYKNLLDGSDLYFENYKDHVLLVDFWATWCPPCRMEIPWFVEFQNKYKDKKFSVIGVSLDRIGVDKVKEFMSKMGINYPVIMATNEIIREYESAMGRPIRSIPTTFIKNRAGEIVNTHIGVPEEENPKNVFEEEIKKLLSEG